MCTWRSTSAPRECCSIHVECAHIPSAPGRPAQRGAYRGAANAGGNLERETFKMSSLTGLSRLGLRLEPPSLCQTGSPESTYSWKVKREEASSRIPGEVPTRATPRSVASFAQHPLPMVEWLGVGGRAHGHGQWGAPRKRSGEGSRIKRSCRAAEAKQPPTYPQPDPTTTPTGFRGPLRLASETEQARENRSQGSKYNGCPGLHPERFPLHGVRGTQLA